MSFIDRITRCNTYDLSNFLEFRVEGMRVGWVKHAFSEQLKYWPETFQVACDSVSLSPDLCAFEQRTEAVQKVLLELLDNGVIPRWHGELYPVTVSNREEALFLIDRASAEFFGIRTFSQHMNGFFREGDELKMWLGKRAKSKWNVPGKLDNMVAGGLPYNIALKDNLVKECWEEAAIPEDLARQARPVGAVSYCAGTYRGLKPDIIYCYDLELPGDFVPRCTDGEVETFSLWPIETVTEMVRDTEEIKHNCNLVIIDFLIRHGYITPEETEYARLVTGLHAH
jgi:8-oxo-dGTP pyrophosphatase MutT (NUDIX family)